MCQTNRLERHLMGSSLHNLKMIRNWDYGILFLKEEDAIGLNTMFKKDSLVMIAQQVTSEEQYMQMIGRSSRARGLCRSIYYPETTQSAHSIM